jgi:alpha-galactosidase
VVGWCSWAAFYQNVTEKDMMSATDFLAQNLLPYGYNISQMDDGFQRTPQSGELTLKPGERYSEYWTKPNEKFPSGLESLATYIKSKGVTPGIWVGLYSPLGLSNSKDYVTDVVGKPFRGPWVNYAINGLKPGADEAYFETFRVLKKQGWNYFKIDTLRHVLYDNYRMNPYYWKLNEQSMEEAFRAVVSGAKKQVGNSYVLACWGAMPELAGIPSGARIGEDVGPDFASMRRSAKYIAQFHHLNNIVWRNDPDYMCLRLDPELARSWASMTSLAGGHLMISDKPESYTPEHINIMRRVSPTVFSKPVNVVQEAPDPEFFTLHSRKFGESWTVISHHAWKPTQAKSISMAQVGVTAGKYHAFDFWRQKYLGIVDSKLKFDSLSEGHCQVISLRPVQDRPQVLGTERHVSQGAFELDAVKWEDNNLSGNYRVGPGQKWNLTIFVPRGFAVSKVNTKGVIAKQEEQVLTLTMPLSNTAIKWSVSFEKS